jgi:hypothetical protein
MYWFTVMCVFFLFYFIFFFVSVITFWSSNNALIFGFSPYLKRKIHLVGTFKSKKFPVVFKSVGKNWKNNGKPGIFTHNHFSTKSIFLFCCNSKTNHCKYFKFSPNVYIMVIYLRLNFQIILIFFKLLIDNWNFRLF